MKCAHHTTMKPHTTAHNSTMLNHSRDAFKIFFALITNPLHELYANKQVVVTMNCAHHTTMTPQDSRKSIINNSRDTFQETIFHENELTSCKNCNRTREQSSKMKCAHHTTMTPQDSRKSIINNSRDKFWKNSFANALTCCKNCNRTRE